MRRIEFRYCKRTVNEIMQVASIILLVILGLAFGVFFLFLFLSLSLFNVMPFFLAFAVLFFPAFAGFWVVSYIKWPKWGEARGYIDIEADRATLYYGKNVVEIARNQVQIDTERLYFDNFGMQPVLTKYKFKANGKKYHIIESMLEAKERSTFLERTKNAPVMLSLREALIHIFPLFIYNPVVADLFAMNCRGVRLIYGISTVDAFTGSPFVPDLIGAELVENSPYIRCYLRNCENMSHIVAVLSLQKAEGETVKPSIEELRQRPILGVTETNMQG